MSQARLGSCHIEAVVVLDEPGQRLSHPEHQRGRAAHREFPAACVDRRQRRRSAGHEQRPPDPLPDRRRRNRAAAASLPVSRAPDSTATGTAASCSPTNSRDGHPLTGSRGATDRQPAGVRLHLACSRGDLRHPGGELVADPEEHVVRALDVVRQGHDRKGRPSRALVVHQPANLPCGRPHFVLVHRHERDVSRAADSDPVDSRSLRAGAGSSGRRRQTSPPARDSTPAEQTYGSRQGESRQRRPRIGTPQSCRVSSRRRSLGGRRWR